MKRVLPLILIVALVATMAVPAMAAAGEKVTVFTVLSNVAVLPSLSYSVSWEWTDNSGKVWTGDRIVFKYYNDSSSSGMKEIVFYNGNSAITTVPYKNSTGEIKDGRGPITFTVYGNYPDGLLDLADAQVCDGSTCPATDVNYDGICDDCGMPLVMSLRGYPSVSNIWDKSVYPYGLLYLNNNGVPVLYFLDNPVVTTDGVDFRFSGGNFVVYNLVDGVWEFEREGRGAVDFPDLDSGQILKVSYDINFQGVVLMYKDTSFFPTPLWEEMEQVTQGEMMGLTQTMGGTMKTLVACGVGLMACLVVLSLFGKRSLIFRS